MLGLRTEQAIQDCQLPDCHFSMVEMDIQRSSSECGSLV
ncbi:YopJ family acetyltransferase [Bartonella sp. ML70XJBT.G]|nr:YopJ family acetyltransferase [Bartonella sp. ML70XJBT.G]